MDPARLEKFARLEREDQTLLMVYAQLRSQEEMGFYEGLTDHPSQDLPSEEWSWQTGRRKTGGG